MIENEVIISKLTTEGIDVNLATGVQFETEEAFNGWIDTVKTFVEKPKAIHEYTLEELRSGADKGEFKNLQSLLDKVRTDAKTKSTSTEAPKNNAELEAIKAQLEEFKNGLTASQEAVKAEKLNSYLTLKTNGFDQLEVSMLKATLPATATEADIDKAVADYKALMVKRGLKSYSTDASSGKKGELNSDFSSAIQKFKDSKLKK